MAAKQDFKYENTLPTMKGKCVWPKGVLTQQFFFSLFLKQNSQNDTLKWTQIIIFFQFLPLSTIRRSDL